MNEFFQKHKTFIIIGVSASIFFAVIILAVISLNNQAATEPSAQVIDPNALDYGFIQNQQLSDEDKFLMLTAKLMVEQYGTYSAEDLRGLWDVKNQSTPSFALYIDTLVNQVGTKNISTEVDPDSVSKTGSGANATVTMTGTETDLVKNTSRPVRYIVQLVKQGEFWLVNNILVQ